MTKDRSSFSFASPVLLMTLLSFGLACGAGDVQTDPTAAAEMGYFPLQLVLSADRASYRAGEPIMVEVVATNVSRRAQRLLGWTLPVDESAGDAFTVSTGGQLLPFTGKLFRRGDPVPEDYLDSAPGQSVRGRLDLGGLYAFEQVGEYHVTITREVFGADGSTLEYPKASTSFRLSEKRPLPADDLSSSSSALIIPVPGGNAFSASCTADQRRFATDARANGALMARRAHDALSARETTSPWFQRWFGPWKESRFNTVLANFGRISAALRDQTISHFCDPTGGICKGSVVAWVRKDQAYKVHLCPGFFGMRDVGLKSKADTMVHEVSHFNAVAGTDDHCYGTFDCEAMARSTTKVDNTAKNADSYALFAAGALGAGFTIESDKSFTLKMRPQGGVRHLARIVLDDGCGNTPNLDCQWLFHRGMIVSARNPTLAINALDGARFGTPLALHQACTPENPDCTWTYRKGMFISDRNPALAINAGGGAADGTALILHDSCLETNTDCTWTQRGLMLTSGKNPELAFYASGGAKQGAEVRLNLGCPSQVTTDDCTWTYRKGMLVNENLGRLPLNAGGGAVHGRALILHKDCTDANPDCTWSYQRGMFRSDRDPTLVINAWNGARQNAQVALHNGCTQQNLDCTFASEMKR